MYSHKWALQVCCMILLCYKIQEVRTFEQEYKLRYEYKYSFKGPTLSQEGQGIPFWNTQSDAVPGADQVRVAPSLRDKQGAVWTKAEFPYENWQVDLSFRIHGRGRIGADGFVFWYTALPDQSGPVFGSKDYWKGLGVFFDSFDNDEMQNNPYVAVILNDGTASYSHATDGVEQAKGGCRRFFRNRPYPVQARITYYNKSLKVYTTSGNVLKEEFELCTAVDNVELPRYYHFGISAATGGLADDHDILKFLTSSLHPLTTDEEASMMDEARRRELDAQRSLEEEYEKNLRDFYEEQEKFKQEHPDKLKAPKADPEDLYQGDTSDELRAVFEVQSKISKQINDLSSITIMMMNKQEGIVSKLEQSRPPDVAQAKSYEIENVVKVQRTTFSAITELQNQLNFLKSSALTLSKNVAQLGAGRNDAYIASKQYESQKQMLDVQEIIELIYDGIYNLETSSKNPPKLSCPKPETPSCAPLTGLIVVAVVQVVILLAYHSFIQSRDRAAKKFF